MTTPTLFFSRRKKYHSAPKRGVSPVIATTIILAITVVLGLSLWSFANSGVSVATQTYADVVTEYGKYVSDRFVVPTATFDHPDPDDVTVWVYNSGSFATEIQSVIITCKGTCNASFSPVQLTEGELHLSTPDTVVAPKSLKALQFNSDIIGASFTPGDTYQIQVVSTTGAYQTIYQEMK
jgi:flagellin-like protein